MIIEKVIRKIKSFASTIPLLIKRRKLKSIYEKSSTFPKDINLLSKKNSPDINFTFAHELRKKSLLENENKYASKDYRILFHLPESGVGIVWFKDLVQILKHTGIECLTIPYKDAEFITKWNTFQPNVFVSIDIPKIIQDLDLDFIESYKQKNGCVRLYTPYPKHHFPKSGMSNEDQWRLNLAINGKTADAYFCMFVDDYWTLAQTEWEQAGFKYLSLPHGCNPIYQYPRGGRKKYDFFMATSYGPERLRITWEYMKPVFENYHGLWAGPDWGFGLGYVKSTQLPQFYAESKIVPNPLADMLIQYPMEITERTFSAMANGAFQITDRTSVTNQFFAEDELIQVNGREDFLEKFDYYIHHEDERNEVLKKGMLRLYRDHTYFHRIDSLIAFLDQNQSYRDEFPIK